MASKKKKATSADKKKEDLLEYVSKEKSKFKTTRYYFTKTGKPENYVRERYTSRGQRFYNPKQTQMDDYKNTFKASLLEHEKKYLESLIQDPTKTYYIKLTMGFYFPIPKADSKKTTALKEYGVILPAIRPDLDNFDKFILDVMHDVLYDDDKRVVEIQSFKKYSSEPRTTIIADVSEYIE